MGFINDKQELFNELNGLKTIEELAPQFGQLQKNFTSGVDSVKSKSGNIVPLLLDLLKQLIGSNLKDSFDDLLLKTDKIETKVKKTMVSTIMKNTSKKKDFNLQSVQNPLLETNVKNIDIEGTLKIDPDTEMGKFYYGKAAKTVPSLPGEPSVNISAEPGGDFTRFLSDVRKNGSGNWKNILNIEWPSGGEQMKVNLDQSYQDGSKSFENFLTDFLDSVKILDLGLLLSTILDTLFGAVSSLTDAGSEWLENKMKLKELVDKVVDKESLSKKGEPTVYDTNFFNFTDEEKNRINNATNSLTNGNNLADLGCGIFESSVDLRDFDSAFNLLNESSPSSIKKGLTESTDKILKKSTNGLDEDNKKTVELNIISEIFNNLTTIIFSQTIKPFNVILQQIGEGLMNQDVTNPIGNIGAPGVQINNNSLEKSSVEDYFQKFRTLNICIIKDIYSTIVEFLFGLVKKEILVLLKVRIELLLNTQFQNYRLHIEKAKELLKTVTNLLSFVNNLSG